MNKYSLTGSSVPDFCLHLTIAIRQKESKLFGFLFELNWDEYIVFQIRHYESFQVKVICKDPKLKLLSVLK